jgi:hypothetical protein
MIMYTASLLHSGPAQGAGKRKRPPVSKDFFGIAQQETETTGNSTGI